MKILLELPPPARNVLPVINHAGAVYKTWHQYRSDLPKSARYTLGDKIDTTFIRALEFLYIASYQSKTEKLPTLRSAIRAIDVLKFFLRIAWELHVLDTKKYANVSEEVEELGRMVGGWKKGLESKTLAP